MDRLSGCPVGVLDVSNDGNVVDANDTAATVLDTDHETLVGSHVDEAFPHSVERTLPRLFADGEPDETHEFEEYYPTVDRWLSVTVTPTDGDVRVYVADATSRYEQRQTADRLRDELDRIAVISELVSAILVELVGATNREDIAETVCTKLGQTDRYEFAWFGEREIGGDDVVIRA
ncbi:MAG: PAS domain-containing protein, partial [Halobaculum sp.]